MGSGAILGYVSHTLAMSATPSQLFTLNGASYDGSLLPPEGQQLLSLVTEAQAELARLETRKALLQAAQQQLISQLKPLLPIPIPTQPAGAAGILGHASDMIPTTPVEMPSEEPAPFPEFIPEAIRAQ
jgi:hypothetical protein